MKTKFLTIILATLMFTNIINASAMTTETFNNHIPSQDGLTEYRIANSERYSKWASYLEKKYSILFSNSDNPFQHYYGDRTPTCEAKRWEIMNILYLINEDQFLKESSYLGFTKESRMTPDGPFFLEDEIYEHIYKLINGKFISGYADGTYGTFNQVTRAEFVKMLDAFNYLPQAKSVQSDFVDTKGHWAESYIGRAADAGIIYGFSEELFMPDNNITIEQILAILDRVLLNQVGEIQNAFIKTYTTKLISPYGAYGEEVILNDCRLLTEKEKDYVNNYETTYRPKLAEYYAYISNEIPSEVYDFPFIVNAIPYMASPSTVYQSSDIVDYKRGARRSEEVLNQLLNINYETITYDDLYNTIRSNCLGGISYSYGSEDVLKNYIEYVKNNKIKIKGTATPIMPIMYLDGMSIRVRMKIDFVIESADTNLNLLLRPSFMEEDFVYDKSHYSFYTDVRMGRPIDSSDRYYFPEDIMRLEHFGEISF